MRLDLERTIGACVLLLAVGCSGTSMLGADASADTGAPSDMVLVTAGAFFMGCDTSADHRCSPDESPGRMVTLAAFEIDRNEVTRGAYAECVSAGACTPSTDPTAMHADHPVVFVTNEQAAGYCRFRGARLPTEAEWEKAARGPDSRVYPWGADSPNCDLANSYGCTGATDAVGSHPMGASPNGALDMAGNVEEWTADWYDPLYYSAAAATDPTGPAIGPYHVRRGGTFDYVVPFLRTSSRGDADVEGPKANLGFRCARSLGAAVPDGGAPVGMDGG